MIMQMSRGLFGGKKSSCDYLMMCACQVVLRHTYQDLGNGCAVQNVQGSMGATYMYNFVRHLSSI